MPRLRTTLAAVAVGAAVIATGAVATTNALATPAPVAAVAEVGPDSAAMNAAPAASGGTTAPRAAARGWWDGLTDDQRSCLADAKLTRPVGPLDDAERAALRARVQTAATTCGVTLPFGKARAFWNDLTEEQRACLKDAAVTRPWGPLTKEQRQDVRADLKAAAQKCGITLPTKARATL